jgi:transcriptional regulator with XRE-family HTH domain
MKAVTIVRFDKNMIKKPKKPIWAINAENKMKFLGLTQRDLLDVFEVKTSGAIGHYFSGRREPDIYGIMRLAEMLNIPLLVLLGINDQAELNATNVKSGRNLTDAFRILSRVAGLNENEIKVFFTVYEKIGADNIIKAVNELILAGNDSDAKIDAIIYIQDFMKKVS